MRATLCCFSRFSLNIVRVSEVIGRLLDLRSVLSSLPCSAHSPRISPNFRSYPFFPFTSSPRQSLIIVINCFDFMICYDNCFFIFKFVVLLSKRRDFDCLSVNYYACRVPNTFADCTLRFMGLRMPDFLRSSSSSIRPLTGRWFSGLVLIGFLGQAARYFWTSISFCSLWRALRCEVTFLSTACILSVAGVRFSSISEISSPSWSSRSITSPSSALLS